MIQMTNPPSVAPSGVTVGFVRIGRTIRLVISGELDMAAAPVLLGRITSVELLEPITLVGAVAIDADLRGVAFADSAGFAGLHDALGLLRRRGFVVSVGRASPAIDRISRPTRLDLVA
jgi:ABC-type transporter Mla MlaB component